MSAMRLFVYEHCPYCVRVLTAFGLKNIPVEVIVLPNDDEATPISMIGKKECPILAKSDGSFMGESLDIVDYIDQLDGSPIFASSAKREELTAWLKNANFIFKQLLYPRWIISPVGEFKTQSAIDYFTHKKTKELGSFTDALANSEALIKKLEIELGILAPMINSSKHINETLSIDDLDFFARLRAITLVKGINIPDSISDYIEYFSAESKLPTFYDVAQ